MLAGRDDSVDAERPKCAECRTQPLRRFLAPAGPAIPRQNR